ncbi:MAG TPA: sulfotransferase [Acidimicrobiia bacterium]|nr:sulfotransferase [Acidimicrobiia bacterium]
MAPSHALIAGVNKAGTTSLFAALAQHPDIAGAAVKETRYFLPARYGQPLEPVDVFDRHFAGAPDNVVRLEATPSYIYGGEAVGAAIDERLPDPRVLVVLREPVSRAISFFRYQKTRLRFPAELDLDEYLSEADRLTGEDFDDPASERYMAFRGGCYAMFLPDWFARFDPERLRIVYFEDLVADPRTELRATVAWLGLDPDRLPPEAFASENRTTDFKSKSLQRVALFGNDRFEQFLRRHMGLKRRLRAAYYRLNGRARPLDDVSAAARAELTARYRAPNDELARLLSGHGVALADWLDDASRTRVTP